MRIEGSVRANMLAAIASARRWRGQSVHQDTIDHWRRLLDYGRRCSNQPGEVLGDVVVELEAELAHTKVA
jgi:hypothetical protein